jgi:short-subunit dehydrogenase
MILVTGASEGIGYACACLLLERSDGPVLITGRSEVKLMHARKQLARPCDRDCRHWCAIRVDGRTSTP